jgi:hypothetical protein
MTARTSASGWMPGKSGTGCPWSRPKVAGTLGCPNAWTSSGWKTWSSSGDADRSALSTRTRPSRDAATETTVSSSSRVAE